MKNYIYIILIISLFAFWSCNDYEKVPVDDYTKEYLFSTTDSSGATARRYLTSIYSEMKKDNAHNRVGGDYLDAASDDAISSSVTESDVYKLVMGAYTPSTRIDGDMRWKDYYRGIRRSNTFVDNIDVVPFFKNTNYTRPDENGANMELTLNTVLKAEARFLRALYYFELIKRYGGVPIVGDIPEELGEDLELERNSFEDCVEYIVKELEENMKYLRIAPIADLSTYGHVPSEGSAMALISRVRLYAASPLYSASPIDGGDNPLVGYTDASTDVVKKRWELAAKAASDLITKYGHEGQGVYDLLDSNFRDIFLGYTNKEVIFHVQGGRNSDIEKNNGPYGFSTNALGKAATSPTQNLVDAFPMLDGKPRGQGKYTYSDRTMYENRDPRLEYTVLHNGSLWLSKELQTYQGGANNPRSSAVQKTKTTYYLRKFMNYFEDKTSYDETIDRNWIMFRYAEILLNYAEAKNELDILNGHSIADAKVIEYIRNIRQRAGIESGGDTYGIESTTTCEDMREIIRNERRIELAFEEHRFRDIRRWKIAKTIYEEPLKGLNLIRIGGELQTPRRVDVQPAVNFEDKKYFYPIPYNEVLKNKNMVQNPGWK